MPREPDTPCAVCGKLLWGGRTSLPPGQRTCRPCRRAGRPTNCRNCDLELKPTQRLYCSTRCANGHAQLRETPCAGCGQTRPCWFISGRRVVNAWLCEPCRAERRRANNRRKNAKRRGARLAEQFTVKQVGDRDGWRCHLCKRKVDPATPGTDPQGPTIDHLLPIAAGGLDELVNVALAHRSCNVRRTDRGRAQLRLLA